MQFNDIPLCGWFPPHMFSASKQIHERLKLVDLVVELLDARLPMTSRNPEFARLLGTKPRFLVFNKADLADPEASAYWQQYWRDQGENAVFIDALRDRTLAQWLLPQWKRCIERCRDARGATQPLLRPIRVMIAGIPNVGKSTLINRLVATKRASVGPRPGVTKAQQWVKLAEGSELLDTPGVLWPRIETKEMELKLTLVGCIKDELIGSELVAEYLWHLLDGKTVAWSRFDLEARPPQPEQLLAAVAKRRGLLRAGGGIDYERSADVLLHEYRAGNLGSFTFDAVGSCAGAG